MSKNLSTRNSRQIINQWRKHTLRPSNFLSLLILTLNYQTICTLQLWLLTAPESKIQISFADMDTWYQCTGGFYMWVLTPLPNQNIYKCFLFKYCISRANCTLVAVPFYCPMHDGRFNLHFILSGAITGALTTPLDVMKTRLMIQVDLAPTGHLVFLWITAISNSISLNQKRASEGLGVVSANPVIPGVFASLIFFC